MAAGEWITSARRTRGFACVWAAQALVWIALGVAVVVLVISGARSWQDLVVGIVTGLVLLAIGMGLSVYARGCFRAGLRIGADGVEVANPLSHRVVELSQVEGFSAGLQSIGLGNPTPGIVLDLVDGSHVRVWALAREGLVWNTDRNRARWIRAAELLNARLARLR